MLGPWWATEVGSDPTYGEEVLPMLLGLLAPVPDARYLDLGCGEGQAMQAVSRSGASVVGCDVSFDLLRRGDGPRVRCRLPALDWVRPETFDGAYALLVIEHLPALAPFFASVGRAVRPNGKLVVVLNHPVFTPPGAGPFVDPADGEVLWRWGPYLSESQSREPAGDGHVTFHHRSMGDLLTTAAREGWALEELIETGVGENAAGRDPLLAARRHVPRLLGARWARGPRP